MSHFFGLWQNSFKKCRSNVRKETPQFFASVAAQQPACAARSGQS